MAFVILISLVLGLAVAYAVASRSRTAYSGSPPDESWSPVVANYKSPDGKEQNEPT